MSRHAVRLAVVIVLIALAAGRGAAEPEPKLVADVTLADAAGKGWSLHQPKAKAVVVFFLWADCPASNGYAPELTRLADEFGKDGVAFVGVHSDPDLTAEQAARHAKDHGLAFPIVLDPTQKLARAVAAVRVPTAAVLSPDGKLLYLGRIDDRYLSLGKKRAEPTRRDVREAVAEVLAGKPVSVPRTDVIGCLLPKIVPKAKP